MKVEARASVLGVVYSLIALHNLLIDSKSFDFIVFWLLIFPFWTLFWLSRKVVGPKCVHSYLIGLEIQITYSNKYFQIGGVPQREGRVPGLTVWEIFRHSEMCENCAPSILTTSKQMAPNSKLSRSACETNSSTQIIRMKLSLALPSEPQTWRKLHTTRH